MSNEETIIDVNKQEENIEELNMVREDLYKTEWVDEAKEILDLVNEKEQLALLRCINHIEPTTSELDEIEEILSRYRDALRKQKPTETLENVEKNIQLVSDEKQFLEMLRKSKEADVKELTMYYPVDKDNEVKIELEVYPLTDSSAILDVQSNLNLFKDFTAEEQVIYNKSQNGESMTREEKAVAENLNKKVNDKIQENSIEIMIEYLACQTNLKGFNRDVDYMREVYKEMKVSFLALLMTKVQELIGDVNDVEIERVFRTSD